MDFNPNNIGIANGNYFALPYSPKEAGMVLLSVPWDVTTSYRAGTHKGPKAILEASTQIDLFDPLVPKAWEIAIATLPPIKGLEKQNSLARKHAQTVIAALEEGAEPEDCAQELERVNQACAQMNQKVYEHSLAQLQAGKFLGLVGGEHSVPLGYIRALSETCPAFGILHIDAHADLRCAYEGFLYSHASIMYNATQIPQVKALVQVGIRDYCQDEAQLIASRQDFTCFTDEALHRTCFEGSSWAQCCEQIISALPQNVYISFDIDGLSSLYCPNTGTPVPGGLSFRQADYLLHRLATSGKRIVGFDLCEVAPGKNDEWDANVGGRLLYKLCCYSHLNRKICK